MALRAGRGADKAEGGGYTGLDIANENGYHLYMGSMKLSGNPASSQADRSGGPVVVNYRIASHELLGQRGELVIEHNGREYRLRRTQTGKLILTA
jgi:hemin uptake protein HemP